MRVSYCGDAEKEEKPAAAILYLLTVGSNAGTLQLLYAMKSTDGVLACPVQLVTTPCHLSGVRWWFVCPLSRNGVPCGRRVRKLYLCGKYFGCRHCHNLTYTSSQESDSRVYATLRRDPMLAHLGCVEGMSPAQLGHTLKALTLQEKRLDRLGKRLDRCRGKRAKGDG